MRDAIVGAAFTLFGERGFEQTTVDDIVALAGVGRRSFFRYFPSKESVVFPDHEGCLEGMTAFLADPAGDADDPVARICAATRMVFEMYAANPEFSVRRYELTRQIPALRAHELAVVRRYERTLADYLRGRFADRADGGLRAEAIAASVAAAHNHALRIWLRSGGRADAGADVDQAMAYVAEAWSERPDKALADGASEPDEVVVVVARRGAPMWRVVRGVQEALEKH